MKQYQGELILEAPMANVHRLILDPERVAQCIPDVLESRVEDSRRITAKIKVGIGPLRAIMEVTGVIEDGGVDQARLTITGGGMGSRVDMVNHMTLSPGERTNTTVLRWSSAVSVNGPIASLGGRLLDAHVQKTTQAVFARMQELAQTEAVG